MASARAQELAELLWEMKRANKLGKFTIVARRAGFAPGAGGRTIMSVLANVRKDYPNLQWWRVLPDDGSLEKDTEGVQSKILQENGYELVTTDNKVVVKDFESHCIVWQDPEPETEETPSAPPAFTPPNKRTIK